MLNQRSRLRWLTLWLQGRRRKRMASLLPVPPAPTGLTGQDNGGVLIVISWDAMAEQHDGFNVYRDVDGGGFALVATNGPTTTSYEDGDVVPGHFYTYEVTAFNAAGESAPSDFWGITAGG